jgi:hypothetical protein
MPRWPRRTHAAPIRPPTAGDTGVAVREPAAAIDLALYDAIFRKTLDTIYRAWLRRVAKTTAIDHLRAMRRHAPLDEAFEVEDPAPTP